MGISTYHSGGAGSLPGGGNPDYSSLATWESATDNDLVSAAEGEYLEGYYLAGGHDDSAIFLGATTNATYYRKISSANSGSSPAETTVFNGTATAGCIFEYTGSFAGIIDARESYFTATEIAVRYNGTASNTYAIKFDVGGSNHKIINCVTFNCTSTGGTATGCSFGINATSMCINLLTYGNTGNGVSVQDGSGLYNCTCYGNAGEGIHEGGGTNVNDVYGCVSAYNTGVDYDTGFDNLQYSVSEDGTYTRGSTTTGSFDTDQAAAAIWNGHSDSPPDFSIPNTSDLYQAGNNYAATTGESGDIIGTTWGTGIDASVGAFELLVTGGTTETIDAVALVLAAQNISASISEAMTAAVLDFAKKDVALNSSATLETAILSLSPQNINLKSGVNVLKSEIALAIKDVILNSTVKPDTTLLSLIGRNIIVDDDIVSGAVLDSMLDSIIDSILDSVI